LIHLLFSETLNQPSVYSGLLLENSPPNAPVNSSNYSFRNQQLSLLFRRAEEFSPPYFGGSVRSALLNRAERPFLGVKRLLRESS